MVTGGDFNDVMVANQKMGGNPINRRRAAKVWNNINYCKLMDLGYKGCKFTRSNHNKVNSNRIIERLNKLLANESWINLFLKASVIHLPKTHSDHNPILLELIPKNINSLPKPFRSETFSCGYPKFGNIVKESWHNKPFVEASRVSRVALFTGRTILLKTSLKKRILARLNGIQRYSSYGFSSYLYDLEISLKHDYNNLLRLEEDYWNLRSRINWLNDGDTNSKKKITHMPQIIEEKTR